MRVPITFDYNGKGIKLAKAGLGALLKSTLGLQLGVAGLTTAFIRLGRESVAAAMADEKAYKILGQTLKTAGFDNAIDGVKGLIDAQQIATGVAEDQLIPAYTTLFNALQSVSAAQYSLKLAQDVALATGKDLNQVTSAFAKAAKGSTTALGRLGIGLSKAELASGDFERIIRSLETRFSGSTAAAIETTAVKFDRLKVAVGEAKEEIGKGLLDGFSLAQSASAKSTDQMQQDIISLGTTIGDVIRGIGGVTGQLRTSMPDAISQAIGDGFRQAFGTYGDVAILLKNYGEALRLETETSVRQGFSNVYSGGPRADRPSQETVGRKLLIQQQRASYLAEQARKRAAAAEAARKRAAEAQAKKRAELDKQINQLAKQFDIERISIQAALNRQQDQNTRDRLNAMMELNNLQYMQNASVSEMDALLEKINESIKKLADNSKNSTDAIKQMSEAMKLQNAIDEAKRLASALDEVRQRADAATSAAAAFRTANYNGGLGRDPFYTAPLSVSAALSNISEAQAATALTNMFPELDRGAANPGAYGTPAQPINININALSTMDIQEAVAAAVNSGSRAGLAYTQVFSRL